MLFRSVRFPPPPFTHIWKDFARTTPSNSRLDGRIVNIGSFRGAAGFIADHLNPQTGESKYDYMDFYMGTIWIAQRADLTPVYEMIFRRLKDRLLNWRYRFPELGMVQLHSPQFPDGAETLRMEKLRAELKKGHRQAIENARENPIPNNCARLSKCLREFSSWLATMGF